MKLVLKNRIVVLSLILLLVVFAIAEAGADQRTIVLATDNLPPFFSEKLPNYGFVAEITREAFLRSGYGFEIKWVPWKRAFIMAKNSKFSGVMGAYYNEERSQSFIFTQSVTKADLSFIQRAEDSISYTSLQNLKPYRIGVIRGTAPAMILSQIEPPLSIEEVTNDEQNIKKLMSRRIDLFLSDLQYVVYTLREKYPELKNKLKPVQPPLRTDLIFNAISKKADNAQKIVDDFNHGLQELKEDGTYDNILRKHGIDSN